MDSLVWALGALVFVIVLAAIAVQVAIARNGPAVLNAVDRVTGGARATAKLAAISTGDHPSQKLIVWGPRARDERQAPLPVLIFAHGGSWRSGDPEDYGFLARAFAPDGFLVVLAGYRLVKDEAPDGVYPAMIEDTASAIQWAHSCIARYGGDPDRILLMGHSAGAYNVVMTAMERRWLSEPAAGSEALGAEAIAAVIGMAGPYDFYPFDSPSTLAAFGNAADPEATQVFNHARADAPPMLLIHGENDTLVRPRNSRELAQLIETAGGDVTLKLYPEMTHNDPLISLASPWRKRRDVADTILAFARKAASKPTR
ncbi:MAG: alpha/beta hydrolase [Pseudomonadota bacterium]